MIAPKFVIESASNETLKQLVREIQYWQISGLLEDGEVRKLAARLNLYCGIPEDIGLRLAEDLAINEAAARFVLFVK